MKYIPNILLIIICLLALAIFHEMYKMVEHTKATQYYLCLQLKTLPSYGELNCDRVKP
jgi:hypothetical protein